MADSVGDEVAHVLEHMLDWVVDSDERGRMDEVKVLAHGMGWWTCN